MVKTRRFICLHYVNNKSIDNNNNNNNIYIKKKILKINSIEISISTVPDKYVDIRHLFKSELVSELL